MLRLLAQREEGYEDIGALMGLSTDQVRVQGPWSARRARWRGLRIGAQSAPAPTLIRSPSRRDARSAPKRKQAPRPRSRPGGSPFQNKRLLAQVGGCALILVLLVLFATGAIDIGGSGDESGGSAESPTAGTEGEPSASQGLTSSSKVPTQAVLKAVDGSEAEGRAIFGRLKSQVLLVVAAKNLAPSPSGSSYSISLARSPEERIPIAATKVGKTGTISGQFQVPATALGLLASGFDEMEVSLVDNAELRTAVSQAQKQKQTPRFKGTDVLRGPVTGPVIENAGEEEG